MRIPLVSRICYPLLCCAWICGLIPQAAAAASSGIAAIPVERVPVESSSLVSIGFVREAQVLEIEFRSGAIYRYLGVPRTVFEGMKKAESKGRFFAQTVRGKYQFQRIKAPSR